MFDSTIKHLNRKRVTERRQLYTVIRSTKELPSTFFYMGFFDSQARPPSQITSFKGAYQSWEKKKKKENSTFAAVWPTFPRFAVVRRLITTMASKLTMAKDFKESFSVTVINKKGSETSPDKTSMVIHKHGGFPLVSASPVITKTKAPKREEPTTCILNNQPPEKVQRTTTSTTSLSTNIVAVTAVTAEKNNSFCLEAASDGSSTIHTTIPVKTSSSSSSRSGASGVMVRSTTRPSLRPSLSEQLSSIGAKVS